MPPFCSTRLEWSLLRKRDLDPFRASLDVSGSAALKVERVDICDLLLCDARIEIDRANENDSEREVTDFEVKIACD